jgi:2-dehydro-3-deoxyphosphogluconate aldolase/(4S)-4-hydroxy-2-oxoglutarate aldolase
MSRKMSCVIEKIKQYRLVPVIKIDDVNDAVPLCEALTEGGLPVAEVTYRTDAAEESMRRISKACPDILLGAGTVVTVEQVKRAVDAGASFIVSPGFDRNVVEYCVKNDIAVTPGAITPTEIQFVMEYGLNVAKFFPAENAGGIGMIKALAAPFPQMRFIPTGGIHAGNVLDYLAFDKILACGGSWMVKSNLIAAKEFDKIKGLVAEAVTLIKQP